MNEKIDEGVLRMENYRTAKRIYVRECASSRSGKDELIPEGLLEKKGFRCQASKENNA